MHGKLPRIHQWDGRSTSVFVKSKLRRSLKVSPKVHASFIKVYSMLGVWQKQEPKPPAALPEN